MPLEAPAAPPKSESSQTSRPAPDLKPPGKGAFPEAFGEIEELEQQQSAPKPTPKVPEAKPKPAAKAEPKAEPKAPPKPAPKETPKPTEDELETEAESKKEDEKSTPAKPKAKELIEDEGEVDPSAKFQLAHDLRKEYRKLHKTVAEKDRELAELRQKVEKSPVNNSVLEENKALKKRIETYEEEMRYVDFTKSDEYKNKFQKPYEDAYVDAVEEVKELRVQLPDGHSRPATQQDLDRIVQADAADVRALANELFGDAAPDVLAARRRLMELTRNANREAKRYREEAVERDRKKQIAQAEEREGMQRMWKQANESIVERYPEYFQPIEGDDEYNQTLEAGYSAVDRAHAADLPVEERMSRQAAIRHRAAAFRAQLLVNKRLKARISELEGVVAEYEKSAPAGGHGKGEGERAAGTGEEVESAASELDRLAALDKQE